MTIISAGYCQAQSLVHTPVVTKDFTRHGKSAGLEAAIRNLCNNPKNPVNSLCAIGERVEPIDDYKTGIVAEQIASGMRVLASMPESVILALNSLGESDEPTAILGKSFIFACLRELKGSDHAGYDIGTSETKTPMSTPTMYGLWASGAGGTSTASYLMPSGQLATSIVGSASSVLTVACAVGEIGSTVEVAAEIASEIRANSKSVAELQKDAKEIESMACGGQILPENGNRYLRFKEAADRNASLWQRARAQIFAVSRDVVLQFMALGPKIYSNVGTLATIFKLAVSVSPVVSLVMTACTVVSSVFQIVQGAVELRIGNEKEAALLKMRGDLTKFRSDPEKVCETRAVLRSVAVCLFRRQNDHFDTILAGKERATTRIGYGAMATTFAVGTLVAGILAATVFTGGAALLIVAVGGIGCAACSTLWLWRVTYVTFKASESQSRLSAESEQARKAANNMVESKSIRELERLLLCLPDSPVKAQIALILLTRYLVTERDALGLDMEYRRASAEGILEHAGMSEPEIRVVKAMLKSGKSIEDTKTYIQNFLLGENGLNRRVAEMSAAPARRP